MSASSGSYCVVEAGGLRCGLEVDRVQEVLRHERLTPVPLAPAAVAGLINLRGRIVTAIDLGRRLGSERPAAEVAGCMHVVLRGEAISLRVDRVGEVVNVTEQQWADPPTTLVGDARRMVRGAFKLEDGLLLVLDLAHVLELE